MRTHGRLSVFCVRRLAAALALLSASALCIQAPAADAAVEGRALQAAAVNVATEEELVAALAGTQPILVTQSIFLDNALPIIKKTVSISGNPITCRRERFQVCRIDCKKKCRQFDVEDGGFLTISNLMIARGVAPEDDSVGGSMVVRTGGQVNATQIIFRFNGVRGATSGGGAVEVENGGIFQATNCLFTRNFAGFGGAVAAAKTARLVIVASFFNRNTAQTAGGAVSLVLNSTAILSRNDYHGNFAAVGGAVQVDASTASICANWEHTNNASLAGPQVYAANAARILACRLSATYVVLTTGASMVANCAACGA